MEIDLSWPNLSVLPTMQWYQDTSFKRRFVHRLISYICSCNPVFPSYTLRLLPPVLLAASAAVELPTAEDALAARIASSTSGLAFNKSCETATRLGSRLPITGTEEASISWKGMATNWPISSNQELKGLAILMTRD